MNTNSAAQAFASAAASMSPHPAWLHAHLRNRATSPFQHAGYIWTVSTPSGIVVDLSQDRWRSVRPHVLVMLHGRRVSRQHSAELTRNPCGTSREALSKTDGESMQATRRPPQHPWQMPSPLGGAPPRHTLKLWRKPSTRTAADPISRPLHVRTSYPCQPSTAARCRHMAQCTRATQHQGHRPYQQTHARA